MRPIGLIDLMVCNMQWVIYFSFAGSRFDSLARRVLSARYRLESSREGAVKLTHAVQCLKGAY